MQEVYHGLNTPNGIVTGDFGVLFLESNYNARDSGTVNETMVTAEIYRGNHSIWQSSDITGIGVSVRASKFKQDI